MGKSFARETLDQVREKLAMTNDNDLIRRGSALTCCYDLASWELIAAIPAVAASQTADPVINVDSCQRVVVKPFVWGDDDEDAIKDARDNAANALRALSASLTQSRAKTAAAYERAAEEIDCGGCNGDCPMPATCCATDAKNIRALATPDQSSALAAIEAAAEARGMRKAAEIVDADVQKAQPEMTRRAQRLAAAKAPGFQYAIHRADLDARISCRDKILAAIPQGDATND